MRFAFHPITDADARAINSWRYEGEYAVYSGNNNEDALRQYLDPRSPYFAVYDEERGELIGFFAFGTAAEVSGDEAPMLYRGADRTLSVGLGLRPDVTGQGKGLGLAFVQAGLDFARRQFHPTAFRLFVFPFNQRAITVYERAGFQRAGVVYGQTGDFVEMRRDA